MIYLLFIFLKRCKIMQFYQDESSQGTAQFFLSFPAEKGRITHQAMNTNQLPGGYQPWVDLMILYQIPTQSFLYSKNTVAYCHHSTNEQRRYVPVRINHPLFSTKLRGLTIKSYVTQRLLRILVNPFSAFYFIECTQPNSVI